MDLLHGVFSPAQCAGYCAMTLGVSAFLQRSDRRLKFFNGVQGWVYALHFLLLGAPSAAVSASISGTRSLVSLKTRSPWVAALMISLAVGFGLTVNTSGLAGLMPVGASVIATIAMYFMRGIPMRLALLCCTLLWLGNNIHTHSIGGVALESFVTIANVTTMIRLTRRSPRRAAQAPPEPQPAGAE